MRGLVCAACCSIVCKGAMMKWQMGELHSESCPGTSNLSLQYTKALFNRVMCTHVCKHFLEWHIQASQKSQTAPTKFIPASADYSLRKVKQLGPTLSLRPTKNWLYVIKLCSCCVQAVPVALLPTWGTVQSAIMHFVRPHSAH